MLLTRGKLHTWQMARSFSEKCDDIVKCLSSPLLLHKTCVMHCSRTHISPSLASNAQASTGPTASSILLRSLFYLRAVDAADRCSTVAWFPYRSWLHGHATLFTVQSKHSSFARHEADSVCKYLKCSRTLTGVAAVLSSV